MIRQSLQHQLHSDPCTQALLLLSSPPQQPNQRLIGPWNSDTPQLLFDKPTHKQKKIIKKEPSKPIPQSCSLLNFKKEQRRSCDRLKETVARPAPNRQKQEKDRKYLISIQNCAKKPCLPTPRQCKLITNNLELNCESSDPIRKNKQLVKCKQNKNQRISSARRISPRIPDNELNLREFYKGQVPTKTKQLYKKLSLVLQGSKKIR